MAFSRNRFKSRCSLLKFQWQFTKDKKIAAKKREKKCIIKINTGDNISRILESSITQCPPLIPLYSLELHLKIKEFLLLGLVLGLYMLLLVSSREFVLVVR